MYICTHIYTHSCFVNPSRKPKNRPRNTRLDAAKRRSTALNPHSLTPMPKP